MVEQLGRQAEVESWTQRLEAEARSSPAMLTMEIGRAVVITPNRWWPKVEQRGCQTIVVEEAGAGRWVVIFEPPGSQGCNQEQKPSLGQIWEQEPSRSWTLELKPSLGQTQEQEPSLC